jgi:hypothetical protein
MAVVAVIVLMVVAGGCGYDGSDGCGSHDW